MTKIYQLNPHTPTGRELHDLVDRISPPPSPLAQTITTTAVTAKIPPPSPSTTRGRSESQ